MISVNVKKSLLTLVLGVGVSLQALAHMPYLVPTSFDPVMGDIASFDASFAERFFIPEAAFDNSQFKITDPKGEVFAPETVVSLKTRVAVEHQLPLEGTYRVTTGARHGATFLIYEHNGEEKREMNPKAGPPEDAKSIQHFQAITRADTYITHKTPNDRALKVEAEGLQILPLDNPTELFADEGFEVKLLLDNQSMSEHKLQVYPANGDVEPQPMEFITNSDGVATISLPAGAYLMRARYRGAAPEGAKVPTFSHTTTLSFLVFENI